MDKKKVIARLLRGECMRSKSTTIGLVFIDDDSNKLSSRGLINMAIPMNVDIIHRGTLKFRRILPPCSITKELHRTSLFSLLQSKVGRNAIIWK